MSTRPSLYALLTMTATMAFLPAQITPCLSANDLTTTVTNVIYSFSSAGPNVNAWQITPTATVVGEGLRVFTRNTYQSQVGEYMSVEVWDEDAANPGVPNNRIAGGTWKSSAIMSWQGANLDHPVVFLANSNYWIVFIDPGWSTPPFEPGGVAMPSMRRVGTAWQAAGSSALKFRLYCSQLETQNAVSFGPPCAAAAGTFGTLFTNESPTLGNANFRLEGTGFPGNAPCLLALGLIPSFPTFGVPGTNNCNQSSDLLITLGGATGIGNVRAPTALGHVVYPFPLPSTPSLTGFYFSAQLVVFDLSATVPLPLVTSNAMQVTLY